MKNFSNNYTIDGTAALDCRNNRSLERAYREKRGVVVAFPSNSEEHVQQGRKAAERSCLPAYRSGAEKCGTSYRSYFGGLADQAVQTFYQGSCKGSLVGGYSKVEAVVLGLVLTAASFAFLFI